MAYQRENSAKWQEQKEAALRGNPDKIRAFQFKKGQSGNPKGRPPDVLKALRKHSRSTEELTRIYEQDPRMPRALAEAIWQKAMTGHWRSMWYLMNLDL